MCACVCERESRRGMDRRLLTGDWNMCVYVRVCMCVCNMCMDGPDTGWWRVCMYTWIYVHTCMYVPVSAHVYRGVCVYTYCTQHQQALTMGRLRWVGSIKLYVSFAKEPYKRDDILQKRPTIVSILLTVATAYSRLQIRKHRILRLFQFFFDFLPGVPGFWGDVRLVLM